MLKKYYSLKIYERDTHVFRLTAEILYNDMPSDETIEKEILSAVGCDGVCEVVEQFKPDVPFA